MLRGVGCCCLKFDHFQTWANNTQQGATHRNTVAKRTQHVASNNVAICWVGMLRSFSRGLIQILLGSLLHASKTWHWFLKINPMSGWGWDVWLFASHDTTRNDHSRILSCVPVIKPTSFPGFLFFPPYRNERHSPLAPVGQKDERPWQQSHSL